MAQTLVEKPHSAAGSGLPHIKHPLSALDFNVDTLDVRGYSRDGNRLLAQSSAGYRVSLGGRPLAREGGEGGVANSASSSHKRYLSRSYDGGMIKARTNGVVLPPVYESIPQNVEVTLGDPEKTRLPIFGNRTAMSERDDLQTRAGSRYSKAGLRLSTSSATQKLQTDELEMLLREKIKTSYQEIKRLFKENDPEQNGILSRPTFCRVITQVLNKPLSQVALTSLLARLGFGEREVISFTDLYAVLRDSSSNGQLAPWMDPQEKSDWYRLLSAAQVHARLKATASLRKEKLVQIFYQHSTNGRIMRSHLLDVLRELSLRISESQFDKLWAKYDKLATGAVDVSTLLTVLTTSADTSQPSAQHDDAAGNTGEVGMADTAPNNTNKTNSLRKNEMERQRSLNIERWLKDKFREGYVSMKSAFYNSDTAHTGLVNHDAFLAVLASHGLKLEKRFLGDFLHRCQLNNVKEGVKYMDFLNYFQDRSDEGATHRILNNPRHKYNRPNSPSTQSTISSLEAQLLNMFQRDFLALLATFERVDRRQRGCVSQEEFRAAIESRTGVEMAEEHFQALVDRLPLDEDGNVKYADFMAQFDVRKTGSMINGEVGEERVGVRGVSDMDTDTSALLTTKRSVADVRQLIRHQVKTNLATLDKAFTDVDKTSSGRLKPEMAVDMLSRVNIVPQITHAEMRDLWPGLMHNADGTVGWLEFVRCFGYSPASATYPNAKVRPPQRGDADFMQRSRHLNNDSDMVHDVLNTKIRYLADDLAREFNALDPYHTGCVANEEFKDILSELCVHLSDLELEELSKKFAVSDGRVSYERLLKPYSSSRSRGGRQGSSVAGLLSHIPEEAALMSGASLHPDDHVVMIGGSMKLRLRLHRKLMAHWKELKRSLRKLDAQRGGYVTTGEFKACLSNVGVTLNDDEQYGLLTSYDTDVTGKVAYNRFLVDLTMDKLPAGVGLLSRSATTLL